MIVIDEFQISENISREFVDSSFALFSTQLADSFGFFQDGLQINAKSGAGSVPKELWEKENDCLEKKNVRNPWIKGKLWFKTRQRIKALRNMRNWLNKARLDEEPDPRRGIVRQRRALESPADIKLGTRNSTEEE